MWAAMRTCAWRATTGNTGVACVGQRLALVEIADRVFDMLTQQAAFIGGHVTIATTLIEICGNCSAEHDV